MDELTNKNNFYNLTDDVALKRIKGFTQFFGETHLLLACHAAFPLILTPELLYHLRSSFVPQAPRAKSKS